MVISLENEIKEILDKISKKEDYIQHCYCRLFNNEADELLNYITNLREELKSANESISWWINRFKAVERDNKKLREQIKGVVK